MDDVKDFLSKNASSGAPAVKFTNKGDKVAGTITGRRLVAGKDFAGNDVTSLVIDLRSDDGSEHSLWVKPGQMLSELARKMQEAGRDTVTVGDKLGVAYVDQRPPKQPGFQGAKVYSVAYKVGEFAEPVQPATVNAEDLV